VGHDVLSSPPQRCRSPRTAKGRGIVPLLLSSNQMAARQEGFWTSRRRATLKLAWSSARCRNFRRVYSTTSCGDSGCDRRRTAGDTAVENVVRTRFRARRGAVPNGWIMEDKVRSKGKAVVDGGLTHSGHFALNSFPVTNTDRIRPLPLDKPAIPLLAGKTCGYRRMSGAGRPSPSVALLRSTRMAKSIRLF